MSELELLRNLSSEEFLLQLRNVSSYFDCFSFETKIIESNFNNLFKKYNGHQSFTFFGGSFNPLHLGHLECLKLCPEENIVLVPDRNPLKDMREIDYKSEMLDLITALQSMNVSIYPGFWIKNTPNPTSSWITKVTSSEINFLMGDDSFISIFSWINFELVLKSLSKIYVVPRNSSRENLMKTKSKCLEVNPDLEIVFLSEHDYQHLSSTKIRNNKK